MFPPFVIFVWFEMWKSTIRLAVQNIIFSVQFLTFWNMFMTLNCFLFAILADPFKKLFNIKLRIV